MEKRKRDTITYCLKREIEEDNRKFKSKWDVFGFLEETGMIKTEFIHNNAAEIEKVWNELRFPDIPPTPETQNQDSDSDNAGSSDSKLGTIKTPTIIEDTPEIVAITVPATAMFMHANTKRCEGPDSYINVATIEKNCLQREDDDTVIVEWKRLKTVEDRPFHCTRCIILEDALADAIKVDILFGSEYEDGVAYHPQRSHPSTAHPQAERPYMDNQTARAAVPPGQPPIYISYINHAVFTGTPPATNNNIPPPVSTAHPHTPGYYDGMGNSSSAGLLTPDITSNNQGKRRAEDDIGTRTKKQR
ncbi:hypothetical protein F4806DRAFT_458595 [Annulohypoxylon nitens]|nr:hypothetical protein F4806DRAFT_458595 [Annulohypoxylon nitens]